MAHIKHPIDNDNLYGTPGPQAMHALNSYYLGFKHPISDIFMEFSADLPKDLSKILYDRQ